MIQRATIIVGILLAVVMTAMAQAPSPFEQDGRWVNGVSEPWWFEAEHPREEVLATQKKWAAIESDIQRSSDHRWQGDYFEGTDTHGSYLRWSAKGGFVLLMVDKCRATVMSFSYGQVIASPTSVQLVPEKTISIKRHHQHKSFASVKFLPVIWYKDLLLVPQKRMSSFGDYVAGLGEYNRWLSFGPEGVMFFSQMSPFPFAETPVVPPGYERFLKTPISATINAVGKHYVQKSKDNEWWDDQIVPVTLRLSRIGATPRLNFRMEDSGEIVELTSVKGRSATGRIIRQVRKKPCVKFADDDDCLDPEFDEIKVGTKASTRLVSP